MTIWNLRDNNKQKKYREGSKSKNKNGQHVAHYFSLDLAAYLHKFVSPSVELKRMKFICNVADNFRMIDRRTNLSNHRKIDNHLMDSFENIMIPKFEDNKEYKQLLNENPSKLELVVKNENISAIRLSHPQSVRAKAQAKRVQMLGFPNHYIAFARLFYRCFRDSKGRHIWNDIGNHKEFQQYLQSQLSIDQDNNNQDDTQHIDDGLIQIKNDNKYGIDDKGRILHQGPKGGVYYITASGYKKYINVDEDDVKTDTIQKNHDGRKRKKKTIKKKTIQLNKFVNKGKVY